MRANIRKSPKVLVVVGTRPEAIKLGPVVLRAREAGLAVEVCATAQHRDMLDGVLDIFKISPEYDLDIMRPGQTLFQTTARMLEQLQPVLAAAAPRLVVVQGDTTSTLAGALGGFYARVPVAHVEAGLRTGDLAQPFPEEMNRLLTARLASLHFAATPWAASNLEREGVASGRIEVTGNTGIDAVLHISAELAAGRLTPAMQFEDDGRRLLVVTAHRRESFGSGLESIVRAVRRLAARDDVRIVLPVHPNPAVRESVRRGLAGTPNVTLTGALDYPSFVHLMRGAYLLITDSGGVQEEAPSLGKPVLVLRNTTERPEAVDAGTAVLVGTGEERIVAEASRLLDDPDEYRRRAILHNPYGDGHASERIVARVCSFLDAEAGA